VSDHHQLTGAQAISERLISNPESVRFLLVSKGRLTSAEEALVKSAQSLDVGLRFESENDLRRMGQGGEEHRVLALVGRNPEADLNSMMEAPGIVWLLSGVQYPANVGVAARTVEVAGAAGLVVDGDFTREMRHKAMRIAMRPERFMPVCWESSQSAIAAARRAGRQVIAVEHGGQKGPWSVDLTVPTLLVAGAERDGISEEVLALCDTRVTLPSPGFIPAYNLQIAVAMVSAEVLRQQASCPNPPPVQ
jgi:23S rRNA (guanosine2251-2'-O)-methyltransferase